MNLKKILLLASGWYLISRLRNTTSLNDISKSVDISLSGIDVKSTSGGLFSTTIYPQFTILNQSTSSGEISSISGKLFLSGSFIGTFLVNQKFRINPGNNLITVPVTLSNTSVLTTIVKAITTGGELSYSVDGVINTGNLSVPFKSEYIYKNNRSSFVAPNTGVINPVLPNNVVSINLPPGVKTSASSSTGNFIPTGTTVLFN